MELDFFTPVREEILEEIRGQKNLGAGLIINTADKAFPDLEGVKIAIFGVLEDRLKEDRSGEPFGFDGLRKTLYLLFPGNWHIKVADLGDIVPGASAEDTFYALESTVRTLLSQDIIPVILGGSQDLVYGQYRGYDGVSQMVILV